MSLESQESIRWFGARGLPGVEVLAVDNSQRLFRQFHQTYNVCIGFQPQVADWRYRGHGFSTGPGGIMLMEPGEVHVTQRMSGPTSFRVLFIPPAIMTAAAREHGLGPVPHLKLFQSFDPLLFRSFERLIQSAEHPESLLELQCRMTACLGLLMEKAMERGRHFEGPREHQAVRRARELLHQRWDENLSLDELAAAAGLGRCRLLHVFTRQVGIPPHAYQVHMRITKARSLLRQGLPLAHAATLTGFSDQSHLGRHFKRLLGVTPAEYCGRL